MFVVIPLLWSTLLLAAATSDAQESRVQVLLQGQDAEALREALSSVQGRLTHTLPLVNGIGGEIAADMLEPLRALYRCSAISGGLQSNTTSRTA